MPMYFMKNHVKPQRIPTLNNAQLPELWRKFRRDRLALTGFWGAVCLFIPALYAPFLANGRPFLCWGGGGNVGGGGGGISSPFLRYLFAPDTTETAVEMLFNYAAIFLPCALLLGWLLRQKKRLRRWFLAGIAVALIVPFCTVSPRLDRNDYRALVQNQGKSALFAPIPYGPNEIVAPPCQSPDRKHWCGTDTVGRDVAARMIYGARVSLAVGIFSTLAALFIGTCVGLAAGFFRGWFDLSVMRLVEVLLCFPTFLLLLILMSILGDCRFEQSILIVIGVLSLTGWIGLAFLVRGETLKQRSLPYVESCIVSGIPTPRILFRHLLPNIAGPILISFTFGVAGAILAESGLSFLGFGVRQPTASWGGLLRQAFDNPLDYWHLTLFPGLALFWAVLSFNFMGEGLRRMLSPRE